LRILNEFFVVTSEGLEGICASELEGFGPVTLIKGGVFVSADLTKQECERIHSAHYIIQVLAKGKTPEELKPVLPKSETFLLRCHPSSEGLEKNIGGEIAEEYGIRVDFKSPELFLRCFATEAGFVLGIDHFKGRLSQRGYRVFTTRHSLNPVSGFALGFSPGNAAFLITSDGTPLIEASLKKHNLPIVRSVSDVQTDLEADTDMAGIALNKIVMRGARQNAMIAGAPVDLKEGAWQEELGKMSGLDTIVAPLNFVVNTEGKLALDICGGLAKLGKRALKKDGELRILVLGARAEGFKKKVLSQGYNPRQEIPFLQGKLPLAILKFSPA
jgi:hypothetical protein